MQLEVILPLVAYLVVVFGISVYAMRKRSTGTFLNEYFLGSRSMGGIVLAMTLTATYISASSFIGGPGAAYKYGLGWVLLAMIQLPAVWLSLGILGKKFAILARRYNAVTLNDMLFARYQSRLLVWLASLSLLVAFVGAMTVQFIGGARLLETAAGIPYETGLLIFGISIALYTGLRRLSRQRAERHHARAGDADWHHCAAYWRGPCCWRLKQCGRDAANHRSATGYATRR